MKLGGTPLRPHSAPKPSPAPPKPTVVKPQKPSALAATVRGAVTKKTIGAADYPVMKKPPTRAM